jgi:hypothetical protein|tara:strand:- start:19031 stop:19327 length:297 start_codon:yes stop_codon:yes gene_type:complete
MDLLAILDQYGIPITVAVAFGYFIWKQNSFIQYTLMEELEESFNRLEAIIVKLIDQSKLTQLEQKEIKASYHAIVEILSSLSGNGLKEKFVKNRKKDY